MESHGESESLAPLHCSGPHPFSPALGAASITHSMPIPADPAIAPDYLALPDAPGVCIFEGADGKTVLIATTASARGLARRRLAPTPDEARTARADLRPLCTGGRVHAIRVGSSLEADAVYLHQARRRLAHLARVVAERWRAWFVHVDPDAEFPQWSKTNLMIGLVGKRSAGTAIGGGALPPGVLLGPLPDKDAAGRLIEAMIDAFDLCRFHHILVQAPKGAPCAYKEMGRCPAPCDGTESMPDYRRRTREAVELLARQRIEHLLDEVERENGAAAIAEDAARCRTLGKRLDRLLPLRKPGFAYVANLSEWALLLALGSPVPGRTRIVLAHHGQLLHIADVDPLDANEIVGACQAAEHALRGAPPLALDEDRIDTIGLLTRWLFLPKKKLLGWSTRLDLGPVDPKSLQREAKSLVLGDKAATVESHEIEA